MLHIPSPGVTRQLGHSEILVLRGKANPLTLLQVEACVALKQSASDPRGPRPSRVDEELGLAGAEVDPKSECTKDS